VNFNSQDWKEVQAEIDKRIAALYARIIGPLDHDETCDVRGQIRALQSLKTWQPAKEPEPEIAYLR
jgi:hypothetical protein